MKKTDACSPVEPIIRLAHRFESIVDKYVFQPMKLSPIGLKILTLLKENSGKMTVSELIEKTETTKSNMSQRLSFLEKEAYICRKKTGKNTDKRTVLIALTASGKKRLADLEQRLEKAHISFEKKLTRKELAEHNAFFKKLECILDNGERELEEIFHSL